MTMGLILHNDETIKSNSHCDYIFSKHQSFKIRLKIDS